MNTDLPWCTYRTSHPSGFYYEGKGITQKVKSGAYQGSGIRFKLALTIEAYKKETWSTQILDTFDKEEDAFAAEAALVTLESLADPYRLNMHVGGSNGKYQTHAKLLQKIGRVSRAERATLKKIRDKARKDANKAEIKRLNKLLKEKI